MTWQTIGIIVGIALGIGLPLVSVFLPAMDERNRKKFAARSDVFTGDDKTRFLTREDAEGMRERLEREQASIRTSCARNEGLFVALDDRTGDLEEKVGRIEERQAQQWERVAEQMASTAKTIDDVTRRLERMSEAQQEHALRLERLYRSETPRNGG